MATVLSAVVLFTFRNPVYTFTENATIGMVYVDKIGKASQELSVIRVAKLHITITIANSLNILTKL